MSTDAGSDERYGRAHWFRPEELDEDQRAVYDAINSGPRAASNRATNLVDAHGRLGGPFNAMLYTPHVGNALQALGAAIRYKTALSDMARESCICKVAVDAQCDTEWIAHSRLASAAGVTDEQLASILAGKTPVGLEPEAAAAFEVTTLLLDKRDLTDEEFERAMAALGGQGLMEVLCLVGYYSTLGLSMRVWRTPTPPGFDPVFES